MTLRRPADLLRFPFAAVTGGLRRPAFRPALVAGGFHEGMARLERRGWLPPGAGEEIEPPVKLLGPGLR